MPSDFSRRVVVSTLSITATVLLLVFAYAPYIKWVNGGMIALLSCIGCWEYQQMAKAKGVKTISILPFLSFLIPISFLIEYEVPLFLGCFITLSLFHFRQNAGAVVDLAISTFGLLYIAVPLGMIVAILYHTGREGSLWVGYLLAVTKMTDIGGYFGGSLWGKLKLAPSISPGKTIEGALWGMVFALVTSFVFQWMLPLSGFQWLWMGLLLGFLAQLGDLAESLLKRDAHFKDSNVLPGLGGVLDSVDSLLFTTPLLYAYLL